MDENDIDNIWDVELPPPEEPQARHGNGQVLRILSAIGNMLLIGFALTFAIIAIWGPSTKVDHQ